MVNAIITDRVISFFITFYLLIIVKSGYCVKFKKNNNTGQDLKYFWTLITYGLPEE